MKLELGDVSIAVVRKDIRNLHLSVYPPDGAVRISAPRWMEAETVRLFAIKKLGWIKHQRNKLREQDRERPRDYIERESHYLWGRRYLLHVVEHDAAPMVELKHRKMVLRVRPESSRASRGVILDAWYRAELRAVLPELLTVWEPKVGRKAQRVFIQRMKTKWGSCNPVARHIRLNTELAKKPRECLEYILLHELVHLREPTHSDRFKSLMDRLMPTWRDRRDLLNRLPLGAERKSC